MKTETKEQRSLTCQTVFSGWTDHFTDTFLSQVTPSVALPVLPAAAERVLLAPGRLARTEIPPFLRRISIFFLLVDFYEVDPSDAPSPWSPAPPTSFDDP